MLNVHEDLNDTIFLTEIFRVVAASLENSACTMSLQFTSRISMVCGSAFPRLLGLPLLGWNIFGFKNENDKMFFDGCLLNSYPAIINNLNINPLEVVDRGSAIFFHGSYWISPARVQATRQDLTFDIFINW